MLSSVTNENGCRLVVASIPRVSGESNDAVAVAGPRPPADEDDDAGRDDALGSEWGARWPTHMPGNPFARGATASYTYLSMPSRRGIIKQAAGLASAAGLSGCARVLSRASGSRASLDLPPNPNARDLPTRQHAQNAFLRTDGDGNPVVPRHHVVFLLDLDVDPSKRAARTTERAMRTVEGAYDWSPGGLFHTLAWGTKYFSRVGALDASPISRPEVLSRTDSPELLEFDAALTLSSDVPSHLQATENALFGDRARLNGERITHRLSDVFSIVGRRTGFIGEGLPAAHTDAEGIPDDPPLSERAPMFMGFRSGMKRTQASEDGVTIDDGEFAGGTTMHLVHHRQSLDDWFEGLDDAGRVAHMFSPEFSPEDVAGFTDDVPFTDQVQRHAAEHDVVGHHEKVAQVRRDGKPLLLRRDFNTTDGGHVGVHFLSLQRSLEDFAETRKAMNGWYVRDDSEEITDRKHNGILEFITVVSRANFYVPPRDRRAFPVL